MLLSNRIYLAVFFAIVFTFLVSFGAVLADPSLGSSESKMGADAAREVERSLRLLDDENLLDRIRKIGEKISTVANNTEVTSTYGKSEITHFDYTFKIVDSDEINAFSIPGGYIYVNKGLISFCESDDELAAVLAHEIAHAAHHHMTYLLREQSKIDSQLALIALISLLGRTQAEDMSNILTGAQCYRISATSTFTDKAERDADMTALYYLIKAGYNPVGELTFLERLAERTDIIEWGIFEDHPKAAERARIVKSKLTEIGIPIKRSMVSTSCAATVKRVEQSSFSVFEVLFGGKTICKFASESSAKEFANAINEIMDEKISMYKIKLHGSTVECCGITFARFTNEDESVFGKPTEKLAAETYETIRRLIYAQMIRDLW